MSIAKILSLPQPAPVRWSVQYVEAGTFGDRHVTVWAREAIDAHHAAQDYLAKVGVFDVTTINAQAIMDW